MSIRVFSSFTNYRQVRFLSSPGLVYPEVRRLSIEDLAKKLNIGPGDASIWHLAFTHDGGWGRNNPYIGDYGDGGLILRVQFIIERLAQVKKKLFQDKNIDSLEQGFKQRMTEKGYLTAGYSINFSNIWQRLQ